MKKSIFIQSIIGSFLLLLMLASCKKESLVSFDKNFTGIYFETDSINYSFSVTPIEVTNYLLKVPVEIMGAPVSEDRVFKADVIADKSTAVAGTHYTISGDMVIPKDSINGFIPVLINRNSLGTADFTVHFKLVAQNGFEPVNKPNTEIKVVFNNRVEPPTWKDWQGKPTWPDFKLGNWNPLTYIKFIELFRALEQKAPETYEAMVTQFGKDLANVDYGWPWDYDNTMTKYILIPMYQYFVEQNPSLGVTIPRPSGY